MAKYGGGSITKSRGRWRVRVPDGRGGQINIGTYESRVLAEQARNAALINAADIADLIGVSLRRYGERWLEKCARAGIHTVDSMRSRWKNIIAAAPFADLPVDAVRRADVRDWVNEQLVAHPAAGGGGRPISWQTAKHALGELARCLDRAVEDGLITTNPARGVRLPRREQTSEGWTYLSTAEIKAVLELPLTDEQRTVITVAVYQGLRLGELAALRWENLDLAKATMLIAGSWQGSTKTGRPRRIPMLAPTAAALGAWWSRTGAATFVFPAPAGGPYSRGYDWGWGDRRNGPDIPTRAGITRRVRFHDLRHTCAAHLISGSWGRAWRIEEVQRYLGHDDIHTTQRYAHLMPGALADVARETAREPTKHVPNMSPAEKWN
jgi:integrase